MSRPAVAQISMCRLRSGRQPSFRQVESPIRRQVISRDRFFLVDLIAAVFFGIGKGTSGALVKLSQFQLFPGSKLGAGPFKMQLFGFNAALMLAVAWGAVLAQGQTYGPGEPASGQDPQQSSAAAQTTGAQPTGPQPLNGSVSDYGTTFIFSPPPICTKCIETELGFQSVDSSRYIPSVVSIAPFKTNTDISVLVNLLDSESTGGARSYQFGNRFDFVVRQQVYQKGGFLLTLAPRGAVLANSAFSHGVEGGRAGVTVGPQFGKGNNLIAANITWTGAIGASAGNPKSDYQGFADYFRTLGTRGAAIFFGIAHEVTAGQQTIGAEEGLVIPFRNGQVELETAQLNLNTSPQWHFQTRVIVNWGKLFASKAGAGN